MAMGIQKNIIPLLWSIEMFSVHVNTEMCAFLKTATTKMFCSNPVLGSFYLVLLFSLSSLYLEGGVWIEKWQVEILKI